MKKSVIFVLLCNIISFSEAGAAESKLSSGGNAGGAYEREYSGVNSQGYYDVKYGRDEDGQNFYIQAGPGEQFVEEKGDLVKAGIGAFSEMFEFINGKLVLIVPTTPGDTMSLGTTPESNSASTLDGAMSSGTTPESSTLDEVSSSPPTPESNTTVEYGAMRSGTTPESSTLDIEFDIDFVISSVDLSQFFTPDSPEYDDSSSIPAATDEVSISPSTPESNTTVEDDAMISETTLESSTLDIEFDINFVISRVDLSQFFTPESSENTNSSSIPASTVPSSETSSNVESTTPVNNTRMSTSDGSTPTAISSLGVTLTPASIAAMASPEGLSPTP